MVEHSRDRLRCNRRESIGEAVAEKLDRATVKTVVTSWDSRLVVVEQKGKFRVSLLTNDMSMK